MTARSRSTKNRRKLARHLPRIPAGTDAHRRPITLRPITMHDASLFRSVGRDNLTSLCRWITRFGPTLGHGGIYGLIWACRGSVSGYGVFVGGQPAGTITLRTRTPSGHARIDYWVAGSYGQEVLTHAVAALVLWSTSRGLHRFELYCEDRPARQVALDCLFSPNGGVSHVRHDATGRPRPFYDRRYVLTV